MLVLLELPLLVLFSALIPAVVVTAADSTPSCDCYETDADSVFTQHEFHDFRTITPVASAPPLPSVLPQELDPTPDNYTTEPGIGNAQAGWIQSNDWTDYWATMDWGKLPTGDFPIRMQNSLANVYISGSDVDTDATSKLVLRTHRFSNFQSAAEVESLHKNLLYASIRIRARVTGASGAVAGLFIYQNGQNESDIEILTRDNNNEIRYSNQPVVDDQGNEISGASTSVDMATGTEIDGTNEPDKKIKRARQKYGDVKWDDWHTHRIDWTEGKSSWYVDGEHYLDKEYGVPTVASYFVMNMWSDGGVWSGNMTVGDTAYMEIEWVEMAFNTSGPDDLSARDLHKRADKPACQTMCTIDGVQVVGNPEIAAAASVAVKYTMLFGGVVLAMLGMGIL
ncbi:uncharacterized protein H6S33_008716 [Morchella sextelata]|uniref:uncharacterized protein n=1 Tax=Morchella sextelata TaxID=1174677 RepID=UPI001D03F4E1|nr:uncharacterized protein H6S33_008716 [Morchella sextelata]KAH0602377.1 hypothetical protein H6S33_008716 [Morchella sextelata]